MLVHARVPRSRIRRAPTRRPFHSLFTGDFDALLDGFWREFDATRRPAAFRPRVDVENGEEAVVLTAELPGLEADDFEVVVEEDVLTLEGEKKLAPRAEATAEAEGDPPVARFARSFRIPFEFDADAVSGSYRNGVLTVSVPRPAKPEPQVRTIPVTTD